MGRPLISNREVTATSEHQVTKNVYAVAPGVWRLKDIFVNAFIVENAESTNWILVDCGLKTSAPKIKQMAREIFGSDARPSAIVLTHGHFDHVGSLVTLSDYWGVPVYCHHMEVPFLTGRSKYPPADPMVGGGLMSWMSFMYPRGPINVEQHLRELPEEGGIPGMEEWKWLHTPGHSPGHISLFREKDGVLIAGDACVTTNQQSAIATLMDKKELNGPPKYFTIDWGASARSVKALAALQPQVLATGHGPSMYGPEVRKALNKLGREFWELAMPTDGRYVYEPALSNEDGITYVPAVRRNFTWVAVAGLSALALSLAAYYYSNKRRRTIF